MDQLIVQAEQRLSKLRELRDCMKDPEVLRELRELLLQAEDPGDLEAPAAEPLPEQTWLPGTQRGAQVSPN